MGEIYAAEPVLCLVAVTAGTEPAFAWTRQRLTSHVGPLALESDRFPFTQTAYYEATMGTTLWKQFFIPAALSDPAFLADFKRLTNEWESEYAARDESVRRPLNLDPGYLTQDKLVLASTKNHAHRLYLHSGIYAEMTLQFRSKRWQSLPWTYPDYQQPEFQAFFSSARDYLRQQRRTADRPRETY